MDPIIRIAIPELVVPGKRLGRHIHIDSRSANFPAETATTLRSVTHASAGLPLDQGSLGSCTANALVGALNSVPHWKQGNPTLAEPDAVKLYSAETALEGQPYPPNDPGGTGVEVCKAAKTAGMLSAYQHAGTVQAALLALVIRPVMTGVNWFASMDNPDSNGLVKIAYGSNIRGGHELVADELIVPDGATIDDLDAILVGLWQSWGQWGLGGRFYWTAATWAELFTQGADCTIPRTAPGFVAQPLANGGQMP